MEALSSDWAGTWAPDLYHRMISVTSTFLSLVPGRESGSEDSRRYDLCQNSRLGFQTSTTAKVPRSPGQKRHMSSKQAGDLGNLLGKRK